MSSYHAWTHAEKEDGGTDPIPGLNFTGDRAIEYLWGGPKLNWFRGPPGFGPYGDFSVWTRDLTIDWGGYLVNSNGNDGDEMVIQAPLGPRWSCWHLDICYAVGPDQGNLRVEVATAPFYRSCEGVGSLDPPSSSADSYDIPNPLFGQIDFSALWQDPGGSWGVGGYSATPSFNNYSVEVGNTFRLTGKRGQALTDTDTGLCAPLTGQSFNSGDGLMYYFRLLVDGKQAASSDFFFRIQAVRLSRAMEQDGTLI